MSLMTLCSKFVQDDDEVTKITGGNEPNTNLGTRHITPQICVESGSTTRTVSEMSTSSHVSIIILFFLFLLYF